MARKFIICTMERGEKMKNASRTCVLSNTVLGSGERVALIVLGDNEWDCSADRLEGVLRKIRASNFFDRKGRERYAGVLDVANFWAEASPDQFSALKQMLQTTAIRPVIDQFMASRPGSAMQRAVG